MPNEPKIKPKNIQEREEEMNWMKENWILLVAYGPGIISCLALIGHHVWDVFLHDLVSPPTRPDENGRFYPNGTPFFGPNRVRSEEDIARSFLRFRELEVTPGEPFPPFLKYLKEKYPDPEEDRS